MPTVDTYGNINSANHNKTNIIDFYSKARPEVKVDYSQGFAKLNSNNEIFNINDQNVMFKSMFNWERSSKTQSLATSVNTTFLGSNGNPKPTEDWLPIK